MFDACGGHFGPTPESPSTNTYHYHVQDLPPFTMGCYGPAYNSQGQEILVSPARCRALYQASGRACGDNDLITVQTPRGAYQYDPWCPCFFGGRNTLGPWPPLPPRPNPPPPPLPSLLNANTECWGQCNEQQGACTSGFCGASGAWSLRWGWRRTASCSWSTSCAHPEERQGARWLG